MVQTTTWAKVNTRFEALHRWDEAPKPVGFLQDPHRHEFHITVQVQQFHDDRDVEYIMLKNELDHWLNNFWRPENESKPYNLGQMSCEMFAKEIIGWLRKEYGGNEDYKTGRRFKVEVTEDGENGALVEANPE